MPAYTMDELFDALSKVQYDNAPKWDHAALPLASFVNVYARGHTHLNGNVVASQVSGQKETLVAESGLADPADAAAMKVAVKAFSADPANRATIAGWERTAREEVYSEALAGKLGTRSGGPRGSRLESVIRKVAEGRIKSILSKAGITWPSGKDAAGKYKTVTVANIRDADGNPVPMTASDLIDRALAWSEAYQRDKFAEEDSRGRTRPGRTHQEEAEAIMKAAEAKAKAAAEKTVGEDGSVDI